jgi:hypothetical protein
MKKGNDGLPRSGTGRRVRARPNTESREAIQDACGTLVELGTKSSSASGRRRGPVKGAILQGLMARVVVEGCSSGPTKGRTMRGSVMASVGCAAFALTGCSMGFDRIHSGGFFVQPGKYQFLKCPDLAQRSMGGSIREKDLMSLMERANQDAAGPVVNAMVYSADLQQIRAELEELQATIRAKGCDSLVPAAKGTQKR